MFQEYQIILLNQKNPCKSMVLNQGTFGDVSADTFDQHHGRGAATVFSGWRPGMQAAKHPLVHRENAQDKNYLLQNINSADVEKP